MRSGRQRRHGGMLLPCALWLVAGCPSGGPRVTLVYPTQDLFDRGQTVELFVGEAQTCPSLRELPGSPRLVFDAHGVAPEVGAVASGEVAFLARVYDADCAAIVEGCSEVRLRGGDDSAIVISLAAISGVGCDVDERCERTRCVAVDGATADASLDGGRDGASDGAAADAAGLDAAGRDAGGLDAPADAGLVDTAAADASLADLAPTDLGAVDAATEAGLADQVAADQVGAADGAVVDGSAAGTPSTISSLQLTEVTLAGFTASIAVSGDLEANGSARLYLCSETDLVGCAALDGRSLPMTRTGETYSCAVVTQSPEDPGEELRVLVRAIDPDGVIGGDLTGLVTLRSTVLVEPRYQLNRNWNDYLRNDDTASDRYHQDDVACDGTSERGAGGPDNCLHGGEMRHVVVPGLTRCADHLIEDALRVWQWACQDHDGAGPLEFDTAGFTTGSGLRHLVDDSGFLPNAVTVVQQATGRVVASSTAAIWHWSNSVLPLPDNPSSSVRTLTDSSAIYVAASSAATNGYNLGADRIAVVTLPGVELGWGDGQQLNCNASTGQTSGPSLKTLLCSGGRRFTWIEVDARVSAADGLGAHLLLTDMVFSRVHLSSFDTSSSHIVQVRNTDNSRFSALTTRASGGDGIRFETCSHNHGQDIATYDAAANGFMLATGDNHWNLFEDLDVQGAGESGDTDGIVLSGSGTAFNRLHRVRSVDAIGYSILLGASAHDNWLLDFIAHRSLTANSVNGVGVGIQGSRNVLVGGHVSNAEDWGMRVQNWSGDNSYDTTVVGVLAVSNGRSGTFFQSYADRSTALHLTAVLNGTDGIGLLGPDELVLGNLLTVANYEPGFSAFGSSTAVEQLSGNRCVDVMASENQAWHAWPHQFSIWLDSGGGGSNRVDGALWIGGPGDMCNANSTVQAGGGILHATCTSTGLEGSSTYPGELSTAVLHPGVSNASSFVGKVQGDDATNQADTAGAAAASDIAGADWGRFDSAWRAWGEDGPAFPASEQTGACRGTCRIWDWRLRASDTAARNRHGAFVDDAPCPAAVHGDQLLDDRQQLPFQPWLRAVENSGDGVGDDDGTCEAGELCHNRFLRHALEVVMDGVGDDDGLCESGEACIYTPNVGAYQGEGDHRARSCQFVDGGVSGVTMHAYPVNGI